MYPLEPDPCVLIFILDINRRARLNAAVFEGSATNGSGTTSDSGCQESRATVMSIEHTLQDSGINFVAGAAWAASVHLVVKGRLVGGTRVSRAKAGFVESLQHVDMTLRTPSMLRYSSTSEVLMLIQTVL